MNLRSLYSQSILYDLHWLDRCYDIETPKIHHVEVIGRLDDKPVGASNEQLMNTDEC